jgi:hypothetical protein
MVSLLIVAIGGLTFDHQILSRFCDLTLKHPPVMNATITSLKSSL